MEKRRLRFHENWGLFWRASRTPPPGYSLTAALAKGRGGGTFTSCGGHAHVRWPLPLDIASYPGPCTGPAATVSVPKKDDERLPFSSLLTLKRNDGSRAGHPTGHGGAAGEGRLIWEPRSTVQGSWCLQERQQALLGFGPAAVSQGTHPDHGILRDRVRCSVPVVSWEKSWVSGLRPWLWRGCDKTDGRLLPLLLAVTQQCPSVGPSVGPLWEGTVLAKQLGTCKKGTLPRARSCRAPVSSPLHGLGGLGQWGAPHRATPKEAGGATYAALAGWSTRKGVAFVSNLTS